MADPTGTITDQTAAMDAKSAKGEDAKGDDAKGRDVKGSKSKHSKNADGPDDSKDSQGSKAQDKDSNDADHSPGPSCAMGAAAAAADGPDDSDCSSGSAETLVFGNKETEEERQARDVRLAAWRLNARRISAMDLAGVNPWPRSRAALREL